MSLAEGKIAAVAAVSDMNRAREFYEGKLGLRLAEIGTADELVYQCGAGTDLIIYSSPTNAGSGSATLAAFEVEDLDLEMMTLTSSGVEFERYDQPGLKTDDEGVADLNGSRIAWFRDPDGNTFAISQA